MLYELQHEPFAYGRALYEFAGETDPETPLQVLDPHQNVTVMAACECIIPTTDTPGAGAAGANRFIDTMLAGWYPPADRERFLSGLAELDDRARMTRGRLFIECTAADQTILLNMFNEEAATFRHSGPPTTTSDRPRPNANEARFIASNKHWFFMLKDLTIWGYYTSEVGQVEELEVYPVSSSHEGCASYPPRKFKWTTDPK
jgi:hypothetical protein